MGELTDLQRSVVERIRAHAPVVRRRGHRARKVFNESESPSRKAAAMHLIGGLRLVDCAAIFGVTPQSVYQATRTLRNRRPRAFTVEVEHGS